MACRINYLYYLNNLKENELLYKFFKAQSEFPQKGDWINTVMENIENIGLNIDLTKVKEQNQEKFKNNVKSYIHKAAFKYLLLKASDHSKMENLNYNNYEMQQYFKNGKITKLVAQNYFRFRTRMETFVDNFKNGFTDITCSLCLQNDSNSEEVSFVDAQQHFLNCSAIVDMVPEISTLIPQEIYLTTKVDIKTIKILLKAMEIRKELLLN